MSVLRVYLLRVVTAALLCAGASAVCPKGKKEILHFCCACVLALVVLAPLAKAELTLPDWSYEERAAAAAAQAQAQAGEALRAENERALAAEAERFAADAGLPVRAHVACAGAEEGFNIRAVVLEGEKRDGFTASLARHFGMDEADVTWGE